MSMHPRDKFHRVLICGARDYADTDAIKKELIVLKAVYSDRLVIIEGEAPGADQTARFVATNLDIHVARVHSLWDTRYRGAGPQRNTVMLALDPHEIIAFHKDIERSKGTKDMLKQADKFGVPWRLVDSKRGQHLMKSQRS